VKRALAIALAAAVAGCGPGDPEEPDAAPRPDAGPLEAGPPDAAPLDAYPFDRPMRDSDTITCIDLLEPNDVREQATDLLRGDIMVDRIGICGNGDADWFYTFPNATSTILITVRFTHYDGDLVLELLDPTGALLQRSDFSSFASGEESILFPGAQADTKYFIRVTAKRFDDRVPYLLSIDYR